MRISLRSVVFSGLIAAGLTAASGASAFTPAPLPSAGAAIEEVAGGCGPGWHPNPWGRCVPHRYGGGYGFRDPYWGGGYYGHRRHYDGWGGHRGWDGGGWGGHRHHHRW
jgi:hypothetical protein